MIFHFRGKHDDFDFSGLKWMIFKFPPEKEEKTIIMILDEKCTIFHFWGNAWFLMFLINMYDVQFYR